MATTTTSAAAQGPICNNCGSSQYRVLYPAGQAQINQIVECSQCGLMYAYPLVSSNLSSYAVAGGSAAPLTAASPEVRRALDKLPDYLKIETALHDYLPQRGHVVEVGAFSGLLLNAFRDAGWRVTGIEPDGRAVDYARSRYGIEMRHGTLDDAGLDAGSADAVVMLHVIEHIDDPAGAVAQVGRLLRPGGVFAVETPTYDSLAYRILGRRERSLSCNGHIFFYTEASLRRLLSDGGFEPVRIERVGRTMSIARLLWNIGVMSKSAAIQRTMSGLSARLNLDERFVYLNAGDMLRVYAVKHI